MRVMKNALFMCPTVVDVIVLSLTQSSRQRHSAIMSKTRVLDKWVDGEGKSRVGCGKPRGRFFSKATPARKNTCHARSQKDPTSTINS